MSNKFSFEQLEEYISYKDCYMDNYDENVKCFHKVQFKDVFLNILKNTLGEATQNDELVLFGKEVTPSEAVNLIQKAQEQKLSKTSLCNLVCDGEHGCFEILIYPKTIFGGILFLTPPATIKFDNIQF